MDQKSASGYHGDVIRQILRYLLDHPDAKDTIEGIVNWWLAGTGAPPSKDLQEALDAVVARGWLVERKSPSGRIYSLNKHRTVDIRNFLLRTGG